MQKLHPPLTPAQQVTMKRNCHNLFVMMTALVCKRIGILTPFHIEDRRPGPYYLQGLISCRNLIDSNKTKIYSIILMCLKKLWKSPLVPDLKKKFFQLYQWFLLTEKIFKFYKNQPLQWFKILIRCSELAIARTKLKNCRSTYIWSLSI